MTDIKVPAKRWRLIVAGVTTGYPSEQKAYEALNTFACVGAAAIGVKATVWHWEHGQWALYERAVITENGWESA